MSKFSLRRVTLNRDGYDRFGSYFGTGPHLYVCEGIKPNGEEVYAHLRANTRDAAKRKARGFWGDDIAFHR